jgi:hypothetical protein
LISCCYCETFERLCGFEVEVEVNLLKLKLIYDRQSVGQSVLVSGTHLGPVTNFPFSLTFPLDSLRVCYFIAPSLTRGRVRNLLYNCFWAFPEQSLLGRSPTELTAIFYSHLRLPQPGGPGPHIYIPQEQGGPVIPPGTFESVERQ